MNKDAVMKKIRKQVQASGTQQKAAAHYGISAPYLGEILSGTRPLRGRILDAMGLELVETYRVKLPPYVGVR